MRILRLSSTFVAVAFVVACDAPPSPIDSRIEVRAVSLGDDSMRLDVSVDGHDREVHVLDVEGARGVAVVAPDDASLVTLVSEAEPECVTDDAIACDLAEAAFEGALEELAAEVDQDAQFRLAPSQSACRLGFVDGLMCWLCGPVFSPTIECIGF